MKGKRKGKEGKEKQIWGKNTCRGCSVLLWEHASQYYAAVLELKPQPVSALSELNSGWSNVSMEQLPQSVLCTSEPGAGAEDAVERFAKINIYSNKMYFMYNTILFTFYSSNVYTGVIKTIGGRWTFVLSWAILVASRTMINLYILHYHSFEVKHGSQFYGRIFWMNQEKLHNNVTLSTYYLNVMLCFEMGCVFEARWSTFASPTGPVLP